MINSWTTRFAPSPTGYLHLGHAASAIFVWGLGRALNARVLLRIEDHDQTRYRPEFERAIFADLAWLGCVPDNLVTHSPWSLLPEFYQRNRTYTQHLSRIASRVYACDCSRKTLTERLGSAARYDGHCRARKLPEAGNALRFRVDEAPYSFRDLWLGPQMQRPAEQCGDFVIRDREGQWTYQFAVVCDDIDQSINLVIRGQDLTDSTGRQLALWHALTESPPPTYLHHPLISDSQGQKLGKRYLSTSIASRREKGEAAAAILLEACQAVGLKVSPADDAALCGDLAINWDAILRELK